MFIFSTHFHKRFAMCKFDTVGKHFRLSQNFQSLNCITAPATVENLQYDIQINKSLILFSNFYATYNLQNHMKYCKTSGFHYNTEQ